MKAPKLCPAEPWKRRRIVSSGSPSAPHLFVISLPSIVPTTRFRLRIGSVAVTGVPFSRAGRQRGTSVVTSRASSRPCSWGMR